MSERRIANLRNGLLNVIWGAQYIRDHPRPFDDSDVIKKANDIVEYAASILEEDRRLLDSEAADSVGG